MSITKENWPTWRQMDVLRMISEFKDAHDGCAPTRPEIAMNMGFSSANAAQCHLTAIKKKGLVRLSTGHSRSIKITSKGYKLLAVLES